MKKLMMMAVAIALAGVASAANCNWKVNLGTSYKGQTFYLLSGTTASALATAFASGTATDWSAAVAAATTHANDTLSTKGLKSGADDSAPASYTLLVVDSGFTDGGSWAVADYSTAGYTYEGTDAKPALEMKTISQSGTFKAAGGDVPEPTSAMLLLLGVAGLALKRKVA